MADAAVLSATRATVALQPMLDVRGVTKRFGDGADRRAPPWRT